MKYIKESFWYDFVNTRGAFSACEAIALYNIVLQSEQGVFIELGSHRGRSSMCIAAAMPTVSSFILVEPEFADKEWCQDVLQKVNKWVNDGNNCVGYAGYSLDIIPLYNQISFCFIDSGLHDDMVMDECKLLDGRMIDGGIIAFHDYKNQFTAVERAYNYLLSTGNYEEIFIDWDEIFKYANDNNLNDGELSWHVYPDLGHPPNFVGALRKK